MSKRSDKEFILDMLTACERIINYTRNMDFEDFENNDLVLDAVVRNIEILGEATKRISDEFKDKYSEIPWKEIARTRDKIIHFYFGVDVDIIWDIVQADIPDLSKKLRFLIEQEGWQ